jgi:hypothetical protein
MKAKLHKMESGYILSLNGGIDDPYAIVNKKLAEDYGWYKLSKQNCDEIFGVVDVEKLADDSSQEFLIKPIESPIFTFGYEEGFEKAMELNKDKLFTLEDMEKAIDVCIELMNNKGSEFRTHKQTIIQSLQQPTEIEVEIEMKRVVDETKVIGVVKGIKGSGDKITTYKSSPKLDSNGCLILKGLENLK